jgi:hypothetical protein
VILVGMGLACRVCASALDPSLDISQYAHTACKVREGSSKGGAYSIVQTLDGYLRLGTNSVWFALMASKALPGATTGPQHLPLKARSQPCWSHAEQLQTS